MLTDANQVLTLDAAILIPRLCAMANVRIRTLDAVTQDMKIVNMME
jgi:hypothetical protein